MILIWATFELHGMVFRFFMLSSHNWVNQDQLKQPLFVLKTDNIHSELVYPNFYSLY